MAKSSCPHHFLAQSIQHTIQNWRKCKNSKGTYRGLVVAGGSSWGRRHADRGGESGCVTGLGGAGAGSQQSAAGGERWAAAKGTASAAADWPGRCDRIPPINHPTLNICALL